jgi:hypothetical protein
MVYFMCTVYVRLQDRCLRRLSSFFSYETVTFEKLEKVYVNKEIILVHLIIYIS